MLYHLIIICFTYASHVIQQLYASLLWIPKNQFHHLHFHQFLSLPLVLLPYKQLLLDHLLTKADVLHHHLFCHFYLCQTYQMQYGDIALLKIALGPLLLLRILYNQFLHCHLYLLLIIIEEDFIHFIFPLDL